MADRPKLPYNQVTMTQVKRAILLVAGYGSRLWPITKVIPKSLLNIVNYPVIHYIIEEIAESDIEEVIIVAGSDRSQILFQEYIDNEIKSHYKMRFIMRSQKTPLGMIDAIKHALPEYEPTAVLVGDDILLGKPGATKKIIQTFNKLDSAISGPIIALLKIEKTEAHKYGMVRLGKKIGTTYDIEDLVEKPQELKDIPSAFSVFGRYILTKEIFEIIDKMHPTENKELFLPDAFNIYLKNGGRIYGEAVRGIRFDAGSKIGLLKAQAYFGLKDKDTRKEFKEYLRKII